MMSIRIILLSATAFFINSIAWGQAPDKMSFQAVIRNAANNLVINQAVGLKISLLQGSATGTIVYAETHQPVTNANGLISVEIGGGVVLSGNFTTVNWAAGPYFLKMETDPAGGTNYTLTTTNQLLSVPYAFYASKAGSTQYQTLSISNDTLYLTNGGFVKLPAEKGSDSSQFTPLYTPGSGVTDIDGNAYPTIILNNKEWMAANLRTSRFSNGDLIPMVSDSAEWFSSSWGLSNNQRPAWCYYNNNPELNNPYGKIYNYSVVRDQRNVCPIGWHITDPNDILNILFYLDELMESNGITWSYVAGGAMKARSIAENQQLGWKFPNTGASNISGFNGLPGGYRTPQGQFKYLGDYGAWWVVQNNADYVQVCTLYSKNTFANVHLYNGYAAGLSIRCVKD